MNLHTIPDSLSRAQPYSVGGWAQVEECEFGRAAEQRKSALAPPCSANPFHGSQLVDIKQS